MLRLLGIHSVFVMLCQWLVLMVALGVGAAYAETKAKPDMRVLIDVSGSMKKNDPENLRIPATKLLLNLAQPGSRMGLWTFGRFVNRLVPLGTVDKSWKEKAVKEADKIGSVALFTNIGDALEQSINGQLQKDPAWDRTVVLLSDGMVDISKNPADNAREQKRLFEKVVPKLVAGGYKVHAVALSEQADVEFLKRLANETGGHFSMASTADQLMNVFVDASDRANQPLQVPLVGGKFTIDGTVTEFTALIYRRAGSPPAVLKAPSGQKISLDNHAPTVAWFNDALFDLVTVQAPEKGNWDIEGDLDPDNRVTVVSNLDLELKGMPNDVIEGEKITLSMNLSDKGHPIIHPQFLALMDITFAQQTDKGESFEGKLSRDRNGNAVVPPDGIYTAKLGRTLTEGEHEFSIAVDGKTFKRSKRHHMTVHKEVIATAIETELVEGREQHYLTLQPKVGLVKPESLNVLAEVVDPKGSKSIQDVVRTNTGQLRVNVPPFSGEGIYQVFLKSQGMTASENPFEVAQGPYDIDYSPVGAGAQPIVSHKPLVDGEQLHDALDVGEDAEIEAAATEEPAAKEPAPVDEGAVETKEKPTESGEESATHENLFSAENLWLLLSVFAAANLVLFGGGGFFYMRFLKSQDAEQTKLVDQLNAIKENTRGAAPVAAPAAVMPPVQVAAPVAPTVVPVAAKTPAPPSFTIPSLDDEEEESTAIRPALVASAAAVPPSPPPPPPVVAEPEITPVDRTYRNEAAPLALDDDELIELDDDLGGDDDFGAQLSAHAAASQAAKVVEAPASAEPEMDELDMILAEQEALEAQLGGLDIDLATDPGTASPSMDALDVDALMKAEEKKKFAEDEFMLDNPTTRT